MLAELLLAAPSTPMPKRVTPARRKSGTRQEPELRYMLEMGQVEIPVLVLAISSTSSSFRWMQWA